MRREKPTASAARIAASLCLILVSANAATGTRTVQGSLRRLSRSAIVLGADAATKAAQVRITEMQLGRGIGGKAFCTVTGPLGEVEAAVEAALGVVDAAVVHTTEIIPAPHIDLAAKLR